MSMPVLDAEFTTIDIDEYQIADVDEFLEDINSWPDELYLIEVTTGKYVCTNFTTKPPDPMTFNGLAAHMSEDSANAHMSSKLGIAGTVVVKKKAEVFEIAKSKPILQAVCLLLNDKIIDIFYVN